MRGMTVTNETLERAEMLTVPGMAHWAGGAPDGATCGSCKFYGYTFTKANGDPQTKRQSCEKFYQATKRHGGSLEKRQIACKYFEAKK